MSGASMFQRHIDAWDLVPDGAPIVTRGAHLLPVRRAGVPAMLKVATEEEERAGAALMAWWCGDAAASVLLRDREAILLERATGPHSLCTMVAEGHDDEATRVICAAIARLHAPRATSPPPLVPLTRWFRALAPAADKHGGVLTDSVAAARELLLTAKDETVLHGDIHHANILDFGPRGWLAIDPKGLIGERGFDYANLFCNPDPAIAASPAIFDRRLDIVSEAAELERERLLLWVLAWAGLSAAWDIADGLHRGGGSILAIARLASTSLERGA